MKAADTPSVPQGVAAKGTVGGLLGGKGQAGRAGVAGREEGNLAFRNLLKALNGAQPRQAEARGGKKEAEVEPTEPRQSVAETAAPSPAPTPSGEAAAPAMLLLDALRAPVAEAPPQQGFGQPRGERERMSKFATAKDLPLATEKPSASTNATPAGPAGPAMPSEARLDLDTGDLAALARLAGADGEREPTVGEKAEGKPLAAVPSFTISRQETYLPPVQKLSPFEQVVEPVRQAATELLSSRSDVSEGIAGKGREVSTPTKILHIELKPVELGSIVVKMRLSQGGMEIRIEASKAETAAMLASDRDTLREIVRASGHSIDAVSVETIHVDQLQPDRQQSATRQDSGQSDATNARERQNFDQSRQGDQGREPGPQHDGSETSISRDTQDEVDIAGRLARDGHRYL